MLQQKRIGRIPFWTLKPLAKASFQPSIFFEVSDWSNAVSVGALCPLTELYCVHCRYFIIMDVILVGQFVYYSQFSQDSSHKHDGIGALPKTQVQIGVLIGFVSRNMLVV